jgi:predicted aspartyl protease
MRAFWIAVCAAACVVPALAEQGGCGLKLAVSLPMTRTDGNVPQVPVTINGTAKTMVIDTGALYSMLMSKTVKELGLQRRLLDNAHAVYNFHGESVKNLAEIDDFSIGRMHVGRFSVLEMPGDHWNGFTGLIGPDIMRQFDLDLDYAKAKVNFFLHDHCEGRVVYWAKDWAELPLNSSEEDYGHISVRGQLDGHNFKMLVDTGASTTIMPLEAARSIFGWHGDPPELKRVDQNPDESDAMYTYPFKELTLNGVTIKNPKVLLSHNKMGVAAPEIILGETVLSKLHVYIAYKEKKMYVTPADVAEGLKVQ